MTEKLYTSDHLELTDNAQGMFRIGITPHAGVTGTVVAIAGNTLDETIPSGKTIVSVETNKCLFEIQLPFDCKIHCINQEPIKNKIILPMDEICFCEVIPQDANWREKLMTPSEYTSYVQG